MIGSVIACMKDRQFIDTNILVYAYDSSAGEKHTSARELVKNLWIDKTGCLSTQVLQEFYVTVTRKIAEPITPQQAGRIIGAYQAWPVYSPTIADILHSITIQQEMLLSFWDAMIINAATNLNASVLWTEDLNHGQSYGSITARRPWQALP